MEEQFYLVWPLLVVAAVLVVRGRPHLPLRAVLGVVLGAVTVGSFVYSVVATSADAAPAYFVTPTRAWEFGVGALVALLGTATGSWWRGHDSARVTLGWLGLVPCVGNVFALDG